MTPAFEENNLTRVRAPLWVAVAVRTGPPVLIPEAPALEAAQDPGNVRAPQLQTSATAVLLGPEASQRRPAAFPPPTRTHSQSPS